MLTVVARAMVTTIGLAALAAGLVAFSPHGDAGAPEGGLVLASTELGPCGPEPCPPPGEDPSGEGPCGAEPCPPPGEDPSGEGPCGAQPCPPPGEDPSGEGPCGAQPCPPPGEGPSDEGPCGPNPCEPDDPTGSPNEAGPDADGTDADGGDADGGDDADGDADGGDDADEDDADDSTAGDADEDDEGELLASAASAEVPVDPTNATSVSWIVGLAGAALGALVLGVVFWRRKPAGSVE